jgi:DNA processing protein
VTTLPVSADGQAVALACTSLALSNGGSLKPLTPTDWSGLSRILAGAEIRPRELIGLDAETIERELRLESAPAARLAALLSRGGQLGLELERLASLGIWLITQVDPSYPEVLGDRLGRTAPPVLFGAGPRDALATRSISVVGSRDVGDRGLQFASRLGAICAEQGFAVVSGGARGVDAAAMTGALERGGQSIGITVDPLERLVKKAELRSAIADEQLTLATPFHPNARWHQGNAMRRNRLIYALSQAAVVVASSAEKGGTRAGALENLKADWVPLHVRDDGSPGNRLLISEGGRPLSEQLEDLRLELLTESRQDSLLSDHAEPSTSHPVSAFEAVLPLLTAVLEEPRTEKEVAELLSVQIGQARAWLKRAVEQSLAEVSKKPKRYSLAGGLANRAQMHLDA